MKFLNSWPKFRDLSTNEYQFFVKGSPSLSDDYIIDTLRQGNFPSEIRGNFSFYFKDANRIILAVDHLPVENLFYSDQYCGHIFLNVKEELRKNNLPITDNLEVSWQIKMLFGISYGYETTVKEIKRVPPASYLEIKPDGSKSIIEYRNIYYQPIGEWHIEELSEIFENFIIEHTKKPFGLLLSSGVDSCTILGLFKKLGIEDRAKYISVRSSAETSYEARFVEQIAQDLNIKVDWYDTGMSLPQRSSNKDGDIGYQSSYHRTYSAYWANSQQLIKYHALREFEYTNRTIFTGEVSDQIFGSKLNKILLKYILQVPKASDDSIAELFCQYEFTKRNNTSLSRDYLTIFSKVEIANAFDAAKHEVYQIWNKLETDDLVNKVSLLYMILKGSYNVYNYNQFFDCTFVHPFANGYLFDYIFRIPGNYRLSEGGKTKRLLRAMVKEYISDLPWNLSKTGISILPADLEWTYFEGFKNEIIQMEDRKHRP